MILVVTEGPGSMDLYSRRLAENLNVPILRTDIYQRTGRLFNIGWLHPRAISSFLIDWGFVRKLNKPKDIIHLPNQHLGRYGNFLKTPYIVTVHDLIRYFDMMNYDTFIHPPNLRDRFYLDLDYKGIKKATRIISVSQATKNDLVQHLGISDDRINVVHNGVDHNLFRPVSERMYGEPYILFVGSEHPRKNFTAVVKTFALLKLERRFKELKLVKVSPAGGREGEFRKRSLELIDVLNLHRDVVFTDFVPAANLPAYYSGAQMCILPSLYEGFGLPILEAMACGCPVIVSNISSLPEVAGDAAIKVAPQDIDGLVQAARQILTDDKLRSEFIEKGLKRAAEFSWQKTAKETQAVYTQVANELNRDIETRKAL
jgi:glycosyltransferase involved in cell wall biosynthesis